MCISRINNFPESLHACIALSPASAYFYGITYIIHVFFRLSTLFYATTEMPTGARGLSAVSKGLVTWKDIC